MSTNFGSKSYASAFDDLPIPDVPALRQAALDYLANFDKQEWYNNPITTILKGQKFPIDDEEELMMTVDAFGNANGLQQLAKGSEVHAIVEALKMLESKHKDLRVPLREIEQELLTSYSGKLIGDQCLDFGKQDGITEMEEATMANAVERKLNDMILRDELDGKVEISRKPIYVSCVSNFTLFLDLFRKTIRSLELGIPCIILGRSNTSQHAYRWTELLADLLDKHGLADMITFLSCTLDDMKYILREAQHSTGNLYSTCSRQLAKEIMSNYPNTITSTGGPNTLITTEWTKAVQDAIRTSATIECAGQCTALRHCVIPSEVSQSDVEEVFNGIKTIKEGPEAVKGGMFDGVYKSHQGTKPPSDGEYIHLKDQDAYFNMKKALPHGDINEYWRKVVVDFTQLDHDWEHDEDDVFSLAMWLNRYQPISLAVNAPRSRALKLGRILFEKTGLVVYTVGSTDDEETPPALTCQARPQEAEIFGEFPPRSSLCEYTKFPVFIPSSTPSYDTVYTKRYLEKVKLSGTFSESAMELVMKVRNKAVRGYCFELLNYLHDATETNPKLGFGKSRTALWGLQRPPVLVGPKTLIHCRQHTELDDIAPILLLFFATNARDQYELSVNRHDRHIIDICGRFNIPHLIHTEEEFQRRGKNSNIVYNAIDIDGPFRNFPLVGQFVSLYMPLGHVKSTKPGDDEFTTMFQDSKKWLKLCVD
jgi:hypothetical protein